MRERPETSSSLRHFVVGRAGPSLLLTLEEIGPKRSSYAIGPRQAFSFLLAALARSLWRFSGRFVFELAHARVVANPEAKVKRQTRASA